MKSKIFEEHFEKVSAYCLEMMQHLKYEYGFATDLKKENININGLKKDHVVNIQIRKARKGMVNVTLEMVRPVRKVADYEERKRLEISFLNALEAYVSEPEEYIAGV